MMYLEIEDQQALLVLDPDGVDALISELARLKAQDKFDHTHFKSKEWAGDGELEGNAAAEGDKRVEHLKVVFLPSDM